MSKIGFKVINIPSGVTVTIQDRQAQIKGPKGELVVELPRQIKVSQEGGELKVTRISEQRQSKALHGLVRSLIQNSVIGVTEGYQKTLNLVGTGYRVQAKGELLSLAVGYSHPVEFRAPEGVQLKLEGNNIIHVLGSDKQLVGQVAADIRQIRPPEPYKGKGIRYEHEFVKIKPGKTATA